MGQVIIRKLETGVIEAHRRRARARGVPLEQELREVLRTAAKPTRAERLAEMRDIAAMTPAPPPGKARTPGWQLIREDRDHR